MVGSERTAPGQAGHAGRRGRTLPPASPRSVPDRHRAARDHSRTHATPSAGVDRPTKTSLLELTPTPDRVQCCPMRCLDASNST